MITPREHLRELIRRSGLSQTEVARMMGYSSPAGLNLWLRERQGNRPIAPRIVQALAPILLGTGRPAITQADLSNLLGFKDFEPDPPRNNGWSLIARDILRIEHGEAMLPAEGDHLAAAYADALGSVISLRLALLERDGR